MIFFGEYYLANVSLVSYVLSNPGDIITTIDSLNLPDGRPSPEGFFICLYGSRDTKIALQDAHIRARKDNKALSRFDLEYADNETPLPRVNRDNAGSAIYLKVTRLTNDLEGDIIQLICSNPKERSLPEIIDRDPQIIDEIFKLDMFKKLNVIIWPAFFEGNVKIQVAAVKDTSKIRIKKERSNNNLNTVKLCVVTNTKDESIKNLTEL